MIQAERLIPSSKPVCAEPRPALVIPSDLFAEHRLVTILPVTSDLRETPLFRIGVEPNATDGLHKRSQVMVDKPPSRDQP